MITQLNVISWISAVLSVLCAVWLFGLGIFVLVKVIVNKFKMKKEQKEYDEQKGTKKTESSKE